MIGTKSFFSYRQCPFFQGLCLGIASLTCIKRSQITQCRRDIGVIRTKSFFEYSQSPFV